MTWYSKLLAIIFFLEILPVLTFYIGTQYQEAKDSNLAQVEKDSTSIVKTAVYNYLENEMDGKWDKRIKIEKVNPEGEAYTGKWYSKDAWPWIAFRDNGEWKVLVSRDGFDCVSLETVPIKYKEFFKEVTTNPSGEIMCYGWKPKN